MTLLTSDVTIWLFRFSIQLRRKIAISIRFDSRRQLNDRTSLMSLISPVGWLTGSPDARGSARGATISDANGLVECVVSLLGELQSANCVNNRLCCGSSACISHPRTSPSLGSYVGWSVRTAWGEVTVHGVHTCGSVNWWKASPGAGAALVWSVSHHSMAAWMGKCYNGQNGFGGARKSRFRSDSISS